VNRGKRMAGRIPIKDPSTYGGRLDLLTLFLHLVGLSGFPLRPPGSLRARSL
jgi:hypothetical protein